MKSIKTKDGKIIYPARGPFYCGMSKLMVIPDFNIRLCCPTSTSKQIAVATRFGGSDGIIIQLNNYRYFFSTKLRSFNCSWLSNYCAEDERLLFGGASQVQIENIYILKLSSIMDYSYNHVSFSLCYSNINVCIII